MIIDGFAYLLADAASNAPLRGNRQPLRIKIHRQRLHRTLRGAGMAPLRGRTDPMRDDRGAHMDLFPVTDWKQCFSRTSGNAGKVLAKIAWSPVGKNHRCAVLLMKDDRPVRTGFRAVAAFGAAIKKYRLLDCSGRTQPIGPQQGRGFLRNRLGMFGIFLRGFGHGQDGILQEVAPAVIRIGGHGIVYRLRPS